MLRLTTAIISIILLTSCESTPPVRQQASTQEVLNIALELRSKNYVFQKTTTPDFIENFEQYHCNGSGKLRFNSEEKMFKVKSSKDNSCLNKWVSYFFSELNSHYNFSEYDSDFYIPATADFTGAEKVNYDVVETNIRQKFRNAMIRYFKRQEVLERQQKIAEAEADLENQRKVNAAMMESSRQISNAITNSYNYTPTTPPKQTEYKCLQRCQDQGYLLQFCRSRCEY